MKYKVTYRNGMEKFGTMNTDLGGGRFMLNLFNLDKVGRRKQACPRRTPARRRARR